jgi:hypothetical protein
MALRQVRSRTAAGPRPWQARSRALATGRARATQARARGRCVTCGWRGYGTDARLNGARACTEERERGEGRCCCCGRWRVRQRWLGVRECGVDVRGGREPGSAKKRGTAPSLRARCCGLGCVRAATPHGAGWRWTSSRRLKAALRRRCGRGERGARRSWLWSGPRSSLCACAGAPRSSARTLRAHRTPTVLASRLRLLLQPRAAPAAAFGAAGEAHVHFRAHLACPCGCRESAARAPRPAASSRRSREREVGCQPRCAVLFAVPPRWPPCRSHSFWCAVRLRRCGPAARPFGCREMRRSGTACSGSEPCGGGAPHARRPGAGTRG